MQHSAATRYFPIGHHRIAIINQHTPNPSNSLSFSAIHHCRISPSVHRKPHINIAITNNTTDTTIRFLIMRPRRCPNRGFIGSSLILRIKGPICFQKLITIGTMISSNISALMRGISCYKLL